MQIGLAVFAKARHLLQLFRGQTPRAVRVHQAPDRVQVGQRRQRFGHIIAVEGQGQGLTHPFIVKGLLVDIDGDAKSADGLGSRHHHLIAHLRLDGFNFTRGEKAQFYIHAAGADGLGACPIIPDDEVLDTIQIGEPFFPIIGVALQFDERSHVHSSST